jgi:hypothetical protein
MSDEVITRVEQLANGQQEATTPDNDDETISIDIKIGNDGGARSVADYRSDTEGYDPDTQDEVVDNNNDLSSASFLEFTRNESESNKDEEKLMLEQDHHDTIDPTNNNHDIITEHDNSETVFEVNPEEVVDISSQMDTQYGPCNRSYNLRPRKVRDYGHLYLLLITCA